MYSFIAEIRTLGLLACEHRPYFFYFLCLTQGFTRRCRLSWLTIAPLVCEPKSEGGGGGCGVSSNENSCAHHVAWNPNKLGRLNSIFNL
jgi:hypothetical protein